MFRMALIAAASALALGGCTSASSQTMHSGMHAAMHADAANPATPNCPGASGDMSAMHTQMMQNGHMMQNGQTMPNGQAMPNGGATTQGGQGASGSPMMQGNGQMMQGAQSGAMAHPCPMMQGDVPNTAPPPTSPQPADPHQH